MSVKYRLTIITIIMSLSGLLSGCYTVISQTAFHRPGLQENEIREVTVSENVMTQKGITENGDHETNVEAAKSDEMPVDRVDRNGNIIDENAVTDNNRYEQVYVPEHYGERERDTYITYNYYYDYPPVFVYDPWQWSYRWYDPYWNTYVRPYPVYYPRYYVYNPYCLDPWYWDSSLYCGWGYSPYYYIYGYDNRYGYYDSYWYHKGHYYYGGGGGGYTTVHVPGKVRRDRFETFGIQGRRNGSNIENNTEVASIKTDPLKHVNETAGRRSSVNTLAGRPADITSVQAYTEESQRERVSRLTTTEDSSQKPSNDQLPRTVRTGSVTRRESIQSPAKQRDTQVNNSRRSVSEIAESSNSISRRIVTYSTDRRAVPTNSQQESGTSTTRKSSADENSENTNSGKIQNYTTSINGSQRNSIAETYYYTRSRNISSSPSVINRNSSSVSQSTTSRSSSYNAPSLRTYTSTSESRAYPIPSQSGSVSSQPFSIPSETVRVSSGSSYSAPTSSGSGSSGSSVSSRSSSSGASQTQSTRSSSTTRRR